MPHHTTGRHQGYVSPPAPVYGHHKAGAKRGHQAIPMQHMQRSHHPAHGLNNPHQHASHPPTHHGAAQQHHGNTQHHGVSNPHHSNHGNHAAGAAALGAGGVAAGAWAGYQYSENNNSVQSVTYLQQNNEYEPQWPEGNSYDNDQDQNGEDRWSEGKVEGIQGSNEQAEDKTWDNPPAADGQQDDDDGYCCCGDSDCCGDCDCDCCGGCFGDNKDDDSCCCC